MDEYWIVGDCNDCGGFGCKPPSDTCPTCGGKGLLKYRADYSPLTPEEIAQPDAELDAMMANSFAKR